MGDAFSPRVLVGVHRFQSSEPVAWGAQGQVVNFARERGAAELSLDEGLGVENKIRRVERSAGERLVGSRNGVPIT